jgi:hypothetical protein
MVTARARAATTASTLAVMTTGLEALIERLDRAEARLAAGAAVPASGLTDADPATGERWEAGQAWAHMAEFVPYWHGQIERVLEPGAMRPVSFGRVATDPRRLGAIERARGEPPSDQQPHLAAAVAAFRDYLRSLSAEQLATHGTHPTLGEMEVRAIAERFVVRHLEEHADQLERLRASAT